MIPNIRNIMPKQNRITRIIVVKPGTSLPNTKYKYISTNAMINDSVDNRNPIAVAIFKGKYENENIPFIATCHTVLKSAFDSPANRGCLSKGTPICLKPVQTTRPRKNIFFSFMELIIV